MAEPQPPLAPSTWARYSVCPCPTGREVTSSGALATRQNPSALQGGAKRFKLCRSQTSCASQPREPLSRAGKAPAIYHPCTDPRHTTPPRHVNPLKNGKGSGDLPPLDALAATAQEERHATCTMHGPWAAAAMRRPCDAHATPMRRPCDAHATPIFYREFARRL